MKKTGIFYGPAKGSVAKVAEIISNKFGKENCDLVLVKESSVNDLTKYDNIILGISTIGKANWNSYHKDTDWDFFINELDKTDWSKKNVAIYGLGDQFSYPDNFVDGIGWIYERLQKVNAKIVGLCETDGYEFTDSEGVKDGKFLGLPIDEDNQPELTEMRVSKWIDQLKKEGF
ncbi:MAG: flavodoxin [Marinilabiliaceae bacterium]|nr:flavodoxin [Marinilabiliaceae bacterium]